jgi:hypothetical protein
MLPTNRNSLARIPYQVIRELPAEGSLLKFESGILCISPSPPVRIGLAVIPRELIHARVMGPRTRERFLRGDVDGNGRRNVADAVTILARLFLQIDSPSYDRAYAFDANGDDGLSLADAVFLLLFLFQSGDTIPDPFLTCGVDSEPGILDRLQGRKFGLRGVSLCRFRSASRCQAIRQPVRSWAFQAVEERPTVALVRS